MAETSRTEVRSTCPYCGVGCGVILQIEDGKVTGVRPDPDHPINRGTLCPKGATVHESVHHEERLTRPRVRNAHGKLVEASWEAAYDHVAEAFERILDRDGPEALGLISSSRGTNEENYLAQKFARAVLGTNQIDNCFRICHSATAIGLKEMLGSGAMSNAIAEFTDPGPRTILMVGSNASHAHPVLWNQWLKRAVKNGTSLVVIDPRTTDAAKQADLHLQVRPGTNVALFNAMAHHIVDAGLHDPAFIDEHCENWEGFWEVVREFDPESVADFCGVSAEEIRDAAERYARETPASIVYGLGVTEHRTGYDGVQALGNLALLTGNMGKPSTGINALRGQNNVQGATDMCAPEWLPGYQSWDDPDVVAKFEGAWGVPLPRPQGAFLHCSRMWEAALRGELTGLYVIGLDPALTEAHTAKVERALEALEFLVVQDVFPSATTPYADVVLPAAGFAERDGTFVNTERRVQLIRQAVAPIGESKPDWLILSELAERMGYDGMRYASAAEVFEEMRQMVPLYGGMTHERLDADYGLQWPCLDDDHPGTPYLHKGGIARGRARLKGVKFLPPAEAPDADYPFILSTGRTFMQHNAATMTRRTRSGFGDPENVAQISERDAERLGVQNGDRVRVRTRRGELTVSARVDHIAEGVVWMPFHYAESPTNALTNDAVDPVCGITELKACAARVERLSQNGGTSDDNDGPDAS